MQQLHVTASQLFFKKVQFNTHLNPKSENLPQKCNEMIVFNQEVEKCRFSEKIIKQMDCVT